MDTKRDIIKIQKSTQKDWQKHHQEACGPTKRLQEEQQKSQSHNYTLWEEQTQKALK